DRVDRGLTAPGLLDLHLTVDTPGTSSQGPISSPATGARWRWRLMLVGLVVGTIASFIGIRQSAPADAAIPPPPSADAVTMPWRRGVWFSGLAHRGRRDRCIQRARYPD